MSPLVERARRAFAEAFGAPAQQLVQAPGRVNLIGEHTDYNDGFVLPCAIDRGTVIALRRRHDAQVHVKALDLGGASDRFDLDAPIVHAPERGWTDYVRGMAQQLQAAGQPLGGIEMLIAGDVPQGAGLSSSASLELAVGQAFKVALGLESLDPTTLARLAQRAENQFVGCPCGIMDQLVSARGRARQALLIDCRTLATQAVPMPPRVTVLIAHSMVRRGLVDSEYQQRRAACEAAARHFGVPALRDLTPAQLEGDRRLDAVSRRRARHVISENQRVLDAAQALQAGDLRRMGELMAASHASMRDDFEITVPAIDRLVEIASGAIGGEGGARMTGGGFGGCVVALLPEERVPAVQAAIAGDYRSPDGLASTVFVCRASAGAGLLAE